MAWECIDEGAGLWSAEYKVPGFLCRSSALELKDGSYLVFSPGSSLIEGFSERVGTPSLLVAPNSFHYMGLGPWKAAFAGARLVARGAAHQRLGKKGVTGLEGLDLVEAALPEHASIIKVPHTRIGETWLRIDGSEGVIWCVGDSFFNLPTLSHRRKLRIIQKLLKAAPGPCHSNLMKWGGIKNRKGFKSFVLEQLEADQPTTIVPLHGEVMSPNASASIRELMARRY